MPVRSKEKVIQDYILGTIRTMSESMVDLAIIARSGINEGNGFTLGRAEQNLTSALKFIQTIKLIHQGVMPIPGEEATHEGPNLH